MEKVSLPEGLHELRNPTEAEYRVAASILAEFTQGNGIAYWIKGASRLEKVSDEELKWVLDRLLTVAAASTLKKLARISEDEEDTARFMNFVGDAQLELNTHIQARIKYSPFSVNILFSVINNPLLLYIKLKYENNQFFLTIYFEYFVYDFIL